MLVSETPAHPGIRVPGQLQWTYLTEALVERTPEEQEQFNYSLTLSHNLGYSPDDDTTVIRSPGDDWGEAGTVTTDMEMTDAEKTLTKTMPQGATPMPPVKLHCDHTTSE